MSATSDRWAERLARFVAAGQTVTAFCADEGVSVPSFYTWKRKLADVAVAHLILVVVATKLNR
jgi:hypothetical protein